MNRGGRTVPRTTSEPARIGIRHEHGQILVLFTLAVVAILAGVGLVIDGGNAWAQQRITQNGNDAAAEAGALVLAQKLSGVVKTDAEWDASVDGAITKSAQGNGIDVPAAYYTDICGTLLQPDGLKAADPSKAAQVGGGVLPQNLNTNPDCPSGTVGPTAGVQVIARRQFSTYVSRVIGIDSFAASTSATAATGYLQSCDVESGCTVLPIAVPTFVVTCDHEGRNVTSSNIWPTDGTTIVVPLCSGTANSASVGYIDWDPKAGGNSELVDAINHPEDHYHEVRLPSWQYITATGDASTQNMQTALEQYIGSVVLIPLFDLTCIADPDFSQVATTSPYGCPEIGGNGSNQWYRIPKFAAFNLEQVHVTGNSDPICKAPGIKGGQTPSCLVGKFVSFITGGTVGPGVGGGTQSTSIVGVQLIK